jgi:Glycosyl hydrolase family 3 C terminal domain.
LLAYHPDIVFVEFAVNDSVIPEERCLRAMEGLVRKILKANPLTEIIFIYTTNGNFVPCAKLTVTLPRSTGQIPLYYNAPGNSRQLNGYYGEKVKCIIYNDLLSTPLFPFGFGLSYTSFEYGNIVCDNVNLGLSELLNGEKF